MYTDKQSKRQRSDQMPSVVYNKNTSSVETQVKNKRMGNYPANPNQKAAWSYHYQAKENSRLHLIILRDGGVNTNDKGIGLKQHLACSSNNSS